MKELAVSDDKIIQIKDFTVINGEVVRKRVTKKKKSKKLPAEEIEMVEVEEIEIEEELIILLEENEMLNIELIKERTRRKTLEKLLNSYLKQNRPYDE